MVSGPSRRPVSSGGARLAGERQQRAATVGGFGAILLWSTTIPLARGLTEHVGPVSGAAAVYGISGTLAAVSLVRRRTGWPPARYVAGCGALFVAYAVLLYLAIARAADRQQVLEIALVNYLWPALTLVLSTVLLGRRPRWFLWPATVLALAGVALALTHATGISWSAFARNLAGNPLAYAMAVIAAVCWALYSNLTQRWAGGHAGGAADVFLILTALTFGAMTVLVDERPRWSSVALFEAGFLGVATFGGYRLWDLAMRRGDTVAVAAGSYLTRLLSTLAGCAYLGVSPGPRLWVGCVVLIAGSALSWRALANQSSTSGQNSSE
jgi:drug/metabolite transporter (DMT)-like permease